MGSDLRIGVVGNGLVATELLAVLDDVAWRPDAPVVLGRASTTVTQLPYGEGTLPVDELTPASLEGFDLVFVAIPGAPATAVVDTLAKLGTKVIDLSGSAVADVGTPLVLPALNLGELAGRRNRDVVAIPGPAGLLLASVLGPLVRAGFTGTADATVLLPASFWGREGLDELSKQVVALFNAGTPPRKVFEHGLAFDLLPAIGDAGPSGWTGHELRVAAEVARICGVRVHATAVGVPVFSGISATVTLRGDLPDAEHLAGMWRESDVTLVDGRKYPRPRRMEGVAGVQVARVREAGEDRLTLWAAADNLRSCAVAAVTVAEAWLGIAESVH